ncbi:MAG: hypothetical protein HRT45_09125 [Bdellovibrionales bacterium]|nr:hypothetical protein [Bdellovibrionales bacterium]
MIPSAPGLYGKTFSTFSRDVQNAKNAAEILQLTDRICIQFDGTCTDSSQRSPWSTQNASIGPNRLTREAQSCGDSPYNARSSRPSIAGSGKNQCVKLPLAWGGAACTIEYRADNEERSLISKTIPNGARFSYADRPAVKHGPSGTDLDITTADRSEYRRAWCKRSGIQERIGGTCADGTLVFDDPGFTGTLHAYCNDSVAQRIASEEDRRRRENGCELKWNDHIEANGGSKLLKDGAQVFYNNRTSATFTEYCDGTRTRVGTPVESIAGDAWSSVPLCEKAGIRCEMGVLIQSGAGVTCEYNIMEPGDTCDENTVLTNHK